MAAIEAHNTQLGVLPLPVHPAHDRLQHHKPTDTTGQGMESSLEQTFGRQTELVSECTLRVTQIAVYGTNTRINVDKVM